VRTKSRLPELTKQPILHIDGTPNEGYVLRILQAYRDDCDYQWAESTDRAEPTNLLLKMMNEHCEQRAELLDEAIAILERAADGATNRKP